MSLSKRLINSNDTGGGGGGVYDITNMSFDSTFSTPGFLRDIDVSPNGTYISAIKVNNLGTIAEIVSSSITNYELPTSWQYTSTLTEIQNHNPTLRPYGLQISSDGLNMYIGCYGYANFTDYEYIYQYSLSTPFDVSTRSYVRRLNLAPYRTETGIDPRGVTISQDGVHLYFSDFNSSNQKIFHLVLSTPYNISTASLSETFDGIRSPGVGISPDGTRFFASYVTSRIYQWNLSTPFDLSTRDSGAYVNFTTYYNFCIIGGNFYIIKGLSSDTIYRYIMN